MFKALKHLYKGLKYLYKGLKHMFKALEHKIYRERRKNLSAAKIKSSAVKNIL